MTQPTKTQPPQRLRGSELETINAVTKRIIGAAIEVHRVLGPGLLESIYDTALCIELETRGIKYMRQVHIPAFYKGRSLGDYIVDFIVEDLVVVEIKSVVNVLPIYEAQLMTYLRLTAKRLGLLMNFNSSLMKEGIHRVVL
jgi:GxxExxY protein